MALIFSQMKSRRRFSLVVILAVIVVCGIVWKFYFDVHGDSIYVKRLVYRKLTSSLFTGRLVIKESPQYAFYNFCNGVPCGKWQYKYDGALVQEGEYLTDVDIPLSAIKLLKNDTFTVCSWQEGGLSDDPRFLTISILKPDSFLLRGKSENEKQASDIAQALDSLGYALKARKLFVSFKDALYESSVSQEFEFNLSAR